MTPNEFSSAITSFWHRIEGLQRRVHETTMPPPFTLDLLQELHSILEELRIVEEDLYQQSEELAASREAVTAEHQRYWELFDCAPDGYVVTDPRGIIVEANRAASVLLNMEQQPLRRKPLAVFIALDDREAFRNQLTWLQYREGFHDWEIRVLPRNKPHFLAAVSCTVSRDGESKALWLHWLLRDISERKRVEEAVRQANQSLERQVKERTFALQALNNQLHEDIAQRTAVERQLRSSLSEKEMLLREVHHRVKNNMQIISSLLSLQASQIEERHIRDLFQESHHRIQTMALIHDAIYASKDLANIDLAAFTSSLASYLTDVYGIEDDRITLHIRADAVIVPPDTAIPYGLILNELVANCLKHAFPEGECGHVHIGLQRDSASQALLTVQDNGCGIPSEIDIERPESLGLQLVQALSAQLGGTIALDRNDGTVFILTFPI